MMPLLPDDLRLGPVTLTISNLDRSVKFYTQILGFENLSQTENTAELGAAGVKLLTLIEKEGAQRQPRFSTGLYHIAVLLPTRADLARLVIYLTQTRYPLAGYSDHWVSEAFYLNDPDGNGLELYRDRPRSEWPVMDGVVQMGSDAINFEEFFAEAQQENRQYTGLPAGTVIGHMHLKVGDADAARNFYRDVIGFDQIAFFPGAAFVSAGGYHHHLGMNAWESRGAATPPENAVGLKEWTIVAPDSATLDAIAGRAEAAEALLERDAGYALIADPWQTKVRVITA